MKLNYNFSNLPINRLVTTLIQQPSLHLSPQLIDYKQQWQQLQNNIFDQSLIAQPLNPNKFSCYNYYDSEAIVEELEVNWLIDIFNITFKNDNVILIRGESEPEYFPSTATKPARIEFAHGFFSSALHEISHWCIAGTHRRTLNDYGYWYAPDGRTQAQQEAFERVEIKPQAIECLFSLTSGKTFKVSQDNLFADFDTSTSTFAQDIYNQANDYINNPHTLPKDAKTLLTVLSFLCHDSFKSNHSLKKSN